MEQELTQEALSYLELLTEMKITEGLKPEEARRAALIELGGVEQVKERVREVKMGQKLETMWQDLRYGARMLLKKPGFTLIAIITLALGHRRERRRFSASSMASCCVRLTITNPQQIVTLLNKGRGPVSPANFLDFRANSQSFDADGGGGSLGRHAREQ